jgi:outer membrane receptor protein involved in Fe transport
MTHALVCRRLAIACRALLLVAFALGAPLPSQAPSGGVTVSGRIADSVTGAPVAFFTVQLRRAADSSFVAGRLTTEDGRFSFSGLTRGVYLLDGRQIGFVPLRQTVRVGELSPFLDLGTLTLRAVAASLSSVVVTAEAAEVASALDRKSYTVADNAAQAGGSVLQAMAVLPGVTVGQDGTLQLRGSDKVAVLVDGKQTALTGAGTQRGLENLPASAIERIEIITNPNAKYDANASAGVINLVMKKEEQRGLNGTVSLVTGAGALWEKRENLPSVGPQFRYTPKVNPSVAVNYRAGGTNAFMRADYLHSPTLNKNEFATRTYDDGSVISQQVRRNRRTDYLTFNGGVDHTLGERRTLSVAGLVNREKILDDGDNPYFLNGLSNRTRLWQFLEDEVKYTGVATATMVQKFAEPGRSLQVAANYSFHREDERYFFTNTRPIITSRDSFALLSDEHITDITADYVRPLRQGRVEMGLKGRYRVIPVNMRFFPGIQTALDTGAGGQATYRETIPAAYGTYVYEGPTLEVEGGLRLESVRVDYDVNPNHNTYRSDGYHYAQPFPSARIAWKFDDDHKLSVFASRRVDRPNEVDIRIFPKYDEPELIKVGNPALRPQFTASVDVGYKASGASGSVYVAAFHRVIDATITRIATQVPGSVLLYNVFQNAGRSWNTGGELVWQHTLSPQVSVSTNATVYRNTFAAFSVVNQYPVPVRFSAERQRLISGNLKVNGAWRPSREWDVRVSSTYLAPDLLPQGRIGTRYALDAGVRRSVQRGRGEIVVNATDVLNTMQIRRTINGNGFRLESTDYLETQVVRVGYSRKF